MTLAAIEGRAALATRNLPFRRFRICFGANQFVVRFQFGQLNDSASDVRTTRLPSVNTPASHSTVTTAGRGARDFSKLRRIREGYFEICAMTKFYPIAIGACQALNTRDALTSWRQIGGFAP